MLDNNFKAIKATHLQHKQSNFFITVSKHNMKGYWEIDYVNQTANFRNSFNQRLPSNNIDITDYSDKYYSIVDFLKDSIFPYTKEIIKDKKYIFSTKDICDEKTCDKPAKVLQPNGLKHCNKHKGFQ